MPDGTMDLISDWHLYSSPDVLELIVPFEVFGGTPSLRIPFFFGEVTIYMAIDSTKLLMIYFIQQFNLFGKCFSFKIKETIFMIIFLSFRKYPFNKTVYIV